MKLIILLALLVAAYLFLRWNKAEAQDEADQEYLASFYRDE